MSTPPPLSQRLSGLLRLRLPIWVFDVQRFRIVWANGPALALWRSESAEELGKRDFSDMSAATRTRTDKYLAAFRQDPTTCIEEEWTFYPQGVPTRVRCFQSGIETDDGRIAIFVEGHPQAAPDPGGLRGLEALRHVSAMVTLVDKDGTILVGNPAAQRAFGETARLPAFFADPAVADRILQVIDSDDVLHEEAIAWTASGPRFHAIEARRTKDPPTGKDAIVVHQVDLTERRAREALIEEQRAEILALSAPLIEVAEGVVAVPIVAGLDEARANALLERVLARVAERGCDWVIFDVTGASAKSESLMEPLLRLVQAIKLLGARAIVSGIRADLARQLIARGAELGGLEVRRSLREALHSVRRLGA